MNAIDKLKDFLGVNDREYSDYDQTDSDAYRGDDHPPEPPTPHPVAEERRGSRRSTTEAHASKINNVVGMPGIMHGISEMILIEPRSFEEMPQVIDALKNRRSVILNMTLIRQEEAQRSVDFVAGGTYAIDGHYERIGDNIFLFTPNCVQVSTPSHVIHDAAHPQAPLSQTVRNTRSSQSASTWGNEPIHAAQ